MAAVELYTTGLLNDANLKAYYRMESGALTTDSSGEGHTLTNNNSVGETSSGKFGYAADFGTGNTNKYFSIADSLEVTNGACSIALWVNVNAAPATNNDYNLAWKGDSGSNVGYEIRYRDISGTKKILVRRLRAGVSSDEISYDVDFGTGTWYYLVLTYDGSNVRAYLNGSQVGSDTPSSGNGTSFTNYFDGFCMGYSNSGLSHYPNVILDDIAVFNRQLTADEIESIYDGTINSASPSISPSVSPSVSPSASISPSVSPSVSPSSSISPSVSPSVSPSASISPSVSPSVSPSSSISPSISPSLSPSISPSLSPSISPSASPSLSPSISPSLSPSISPSVSPSLDDSVKPYGGIIKIRPHSNTREYYISELLPCQK